MLLELGPLNDIQFRGELLTEKKMILKRNNIP